MSHFLSCQAITKSYGRANLFSDLSFTLAAGDRLGILGPNGAGKSTLLKLIVGEEHPDSGEITIRRDLRIAYLAQQHTFAPEMTIEQVLSQALAKLSFDKHEWQERMAKVLGLVEISARDLIVGQLSGGWQKRLAIAAEAIKEPDIFLLDEPTNHLDLAGIQWLEKFMLRANCALVLISHDRTVLENVTTRMLEINRRFVQGYFTAEGNYSRFLEKREEHLIALARHEDSLANRVRRELEWLRRGPKARSTKASARIQEAQRLIGELNDSRSRSQRKASADIEFSSSGRKTKRLLWTDKISKSYEQKNLFHDLSIVLMPKLTVGLLGENGSGKSTLLNVLAGSVPPDQGTIEYAQNLKIVYFEQSRESLDKNKTLKQILAPDSDQVIFQGRPLHVASYASRFLFSGDQLNSQVASLSGGEQTRLLIARLMLQPADVLLLDEPTNDLDIDTLEVLEDSLEEFSGAIVLVTHDRLMLERLSHVLITLENNGSCEMYAEYSQWLEVKRKLKSVKSEKLSAPSKQEKQAGLSSAEKHDLKQMEAKIEKAEAHLQSCQDQLESPAIASDSERLQAAYAEALVAQQIVNDLYDRWADLEHRNKQVS
ncbi:MAG: ABC-F family ATP-binding cassette domain-containing protein [Deltaproteobacteria bacterium]|nr:ABC-F family ATP-binding cassette domain-containing protein [Deltaproteobacteria bacterium]